MLYHTLHCNSAQAKNFVSRSSATESVRSSVSTLNSVCKDLEHEEICDVIADQFYLKHGIPKGKVSYAYVVHVYNLCTF